MAKIRVAVIHITLFLLTFFTTTLAGVSWLNKDFLELSNFHYGLPYSLSLLLILSAHEFGHFFAAQYYGVKTTLPYFIPIPHFLFNPFGTMGAVIRIRSLLPSKKVIFDIGIAGPIAGLVATLVILSYGYMTLPGEEYIYSIHPEYLLMDKLPEGGLTFGNSIFFWGLSELLAYSSSPLPMNEIYHYPYLCVGWFGLFVTALNLIPVGQLDGGHILYALVGRKKHSAIARTFFGILVALGISGLFPMLEGISYIETIGWLVWAFLLYFVVKLDHPEIIDVEPLSPHRQILGWLTFVTFILIFTPIPFSGQLTPS
ncbi:MAG: site-2 protease family protein [Ignavibacteriae bacterium]|nr:site-2 protease family protein [Ignavibacteriota bacterium]